MPGKLDWILIFSMNTWLWKPWPMDSLWSFPWDVLFMLFWCFPMSFEAGQSIASPILLFGCRNFCHSDVGQVWVNFQRPAVWSDFGYQKAAINLDFWQTQGGQVWKFHEYPGCKVPQLSFSNSRAKQVSFKAFFWRLEWFRVSPFFKSTLQNFKPDVCFKIMCCFFSSTCWRLPSLDGSLRP